MKKAKNRVYGPKKNLFFSGIGGYPLSPLNGKSSCPKTLSGQLPLGPSLRSFPKKSLENDFLSLCEANKTQLGGQISGSLQYRTGQTGNPLTISIKCDKTSQDVVFFTPLVSTNPDR